MTRHNKKKSRAKLLRSLYIWHRYIGIGAAVFVIILAVTGLVHPQRALRNNCPRRGDVLILTKPIGTGCINRALRAGRASDDSIAAAT